MAQLKAHVIAIGVITIPTGRTCFDWSIYDQPQSKVYLLDNGGSQTASGNLLLACPGSFAIGDEVQLYGNDTQRKLPCKGKIVGEAFCIYEEVVQMLWDNKYDYREKRAFQKSAFKRKLKTSYSVKGIENA